MLLFLQLFKATIKWKVDTKNKKDNPRFIDEETIPLVQDEDYDAYNTGEYKQGRRGMIHGA